MSLESAIERLAAAIEKSNDRNNEHITNTVVAVDAALAGITLPATTKIPNAKAYAKKVAEQKAAEPKVEEAPLSVADVQKNGIAMVARADLGRTMLVDEILSPYGVKKITELAERPLDLRAVNEAIKAKLAQEPIEV